MGQRDTMNKIFKSEYGWQVNQISTGYTLTHHDAGFFINFSSAEYDAQRNRLHIYQSGDLAMTFTDPVFLFGDDAALFRNLPDEPALFNFTVDQTTDPNEVLYA